MWGLAGESWVTCLHEYHVPFMDYFYPLYGRTRRNTRSGHQRCLWRLKGRSVKHGGEFWGPAAVRAPKKAGIHQKQQPCVVVWMCPPTRNSYGQVNLHLGNWMVGNADEQKRQRGIPSGPREFQESHPEKGGWAGRHEGIRPWSHQALR